MGAGFENTKVPHKFVKLFTIFCIFDTRIQEVLPVTRTARRGGRRGSRIRACGRFFLMDSRSSCGEDRLDGSGASKRSHRWGIGRYW